MRIALEFFGPIGDRLPQASGVFDLTASPATVGELIECLAAQIAGGDALRDPILRLAVNDRLLDRKACLSLAEGDRVAILSPFSGG